MDDRHRLLFRRQFVLGPRPLERFPSWRRIALTPSLHLTVHPDLPTCRAGNEDASIVLLGYILDPERPQDGDQDILRRLLLRLEGGGTRESLIRLTFPLGGRWVLLAARGQDRWLFNDPCGYRQIFYAQPPAKALWCASQPALLAQVLPLEVDPEAQAFLREHRTKEPQYWWPGDTTLYRGVRHLQPNHYLDLAAGASHRYWPEVDLSARPTEEVLVENARLLQGLIDSASRRFELALGITAGWDTRTLLAASRPIANRLYCFSLMYWGLTHNSPDIRVPARLLPRLGLAHHIIACPSHASRKYADICRQSVTTAHSCYVPIAQGLQEGYPPERLCMHGTAMPIVNAPGRRRIRRLRPEVDLENIDADILAWMTGREDPFAREAIRRWYAGIGDTNVHVLDLFYWEDREGNWQAMGQAERDIAQDVFVPYNCRTFLINALCVREADRCFPQRPFHKALMHRLWPQVLDEELNPPADPTPITTAIDFLSKLRGKVAKGGVSAYSTPVDRAFQRHPWLTDLERILTRGPGGDNACGAGTSE